jgi:hypothetical protein
MTNLKTPEPAISSRKKDSSADLEDEGIAQAEGLAGFGGGYSGVYG